MKELQKAAPHLVTFTIATAAFVILAIDHLVTGGEAYGGIIAAGGFTLGTVGASGSISTAAAAAVDVSHSALTSEKTLSSASRGTPQTTTAQTPPPPTLLN